MSVLALFEDCWYRGLCGCESPARPDELVGLAVRAERPQPRQRCFWVTHCVGLELRAVAVRPWEPLLCLSLRSPFRPTLGTSSTGRRTPGSFLILPQPATVEGYAAICWRAQEVSCRTRELNPRPRYKRNGRGYFRSRGEASAQLKFDRRPDDESQAFGRRSDGGGMSFFFTKPLLVIAAYLAYDCGRQLWTGFKEGRMQTYKPDWLDCSDWSPPVSQRDTAPVRFWMEVSTQSGIPAHACSSPFLGGGTLMLEQVLRWQNAVSSPDDVVVVARKPAAGT